MELSYDEYARGVEMLVTDNTTESQAAKRWWRSHEHNKDPRINKLYPGHVSFLAMLEQLDTPYVQSLKIRLVIAKLEGK